MAYTEDNENNGSVIRVNRGPYDHYGIYVKTHSGQESVIHYTPEGGGDFKGIVRETSVAEFLDGSNCLELCTFSPEIPFFSGEETVKRARSKLGSGNYSLIFNNCEHFAIWCKTGLQVSTQAVGLRKRSVWSRIGVGAGLLLLGGPIGALVGTFAGDSLAELMHTKRDSCLF